MAVQAMDAAGNSRTESYGFGIGDALVSLPADQQSTSSGAVALEVTAPSGTAAYLQYSTDRWSWTTISASALQTLNGAAVTSPLPLIASNGVLKTTQVRWDMTKAFPLDDAVVFLRPCVVPAVGGTCSPPVSAPTTVTLDRSGAGAASTTAGPVTVALTTGAASVSVTDAGVGGASVGRWYTSFSASVDGPFGRGWTAERGGDHCSHAPNTYLYFDFTLACDTHDLGYDLLRFFRIGGGARAAVDRLFGSDMRYHCSTRSWLLKGNCYVAAGIYYSVVRSNSWIEGYGVPR